MSSVVERQYRDYTRYLKPLRPVSFSDLEMMQSLMQSVDPEEIASVAQLLGNRRGVIRITFKTTNGVERLEQSTKTTSGGVERLENQRRGAPGAVRSTSTTDDRRRAAWSRRRRRSVHCHHP